MMHRNDRLERLVSKHAGSKSGKTVKGRNKARTARHRRNTRQRAVQDAKLDTLNKGVVIRDEA